MKKKNLIMVASALGLSVSANAQQASFQPHETIYSVARDYIAQHIAAADYEAVLAPLDNQLKLMPCPEPLEPFTANDSINPGRNSIGIRCNAANKWSIYLSAVIKIYQPVLVLTRPLQRGETITGQDLSVQRKDVSALRGDFVVQTEQIEHKQALRPIPAGAILSLRNFAEPKLIKRGDKIIISFAQSGFTIRMNGLAMMDGAKGQQIRIKNQSSGRIISATVMEPGLVSVNN